MIDKLSLSNFTVFDELEIDFSPRINVIVGENGTGKTHLLKAAYAICSGNNAYVDQQPRVSKKLIATELTTKLIRLFLPLDGQLGRLRKYGATEAAAIRSTLFAGKSISVAFRPNSKTVSLDNHNAYERYSWDPLFIPAKEVVTFIRGVVSEESDRETIEKLFDDTYLDLCRKLAKPVSAIEEDRFDEPRFGTLFPKIGNAIGGMFEFEGASLRFQPGEFVESSEPGRSKIETVFKPTKGFHLSTNMTAEGFRKIGILQQLLANQSLVPGASGPVFWDEPETNVNPKLTRMLVEILLDFSRNHQQIIIATHDYLLLKWFDVLSDPAKEDRIRYHALYRDQTTGSVKIETCDDYKDLNQNAISDSFAELYDEEVKRALGVGE